MSGRHGAVICPVCEGTDVKEVVYSYPDPELLKDAEEGKFIYGGGCTDTGPNWMCTECRYWWPEYPTDGPPLQGWCGPKRGWPQMECSECGGAGLMIAHCRPAPGVLKASKDGRMHYAGEGPWPEGGPRWHCSGCGREW
jgi:hypothetical protein